jgi:hypothetical protein
VSCSDLSLPGAAAERLFRAGVIDDAGVPDAVQIRPAIEPADLEVVRAAPGPALEIAARETRQHIMMTRCHRFNRREVAFNLMMLIKSLQSDCLGMPSPILRGTADL